MNPLYNTNDSPNGATQPTKAVNRESVHVSNTHNTFDLSYFHYKTQKFAQYEPFFVMEGVSGDTIPFSNSHNVRALPMSSPFLSSLKLNKDFFMIPNQAIQPNTWELIFKAPAQGDDVPQDAYNIFSLVSSRQTAPTPRMISIFKYLFDSIKNRVNDSSLVWSLLILELFCSSGSLLYQLGYKINPIINIDNRDYSFDDFFDLVLSGADISFEVDGRLFSTQTSSLYEIISLLRFYGSRAIDLNVSFEFDTEYLQSMVVSNLPNVDLGSSDFINLDRVIAYQLACSQFYVNPNVDFIYNAGLYRSNLYNLYANALSSIGYNATPLFFDYNGSDIPYDYCSEAYYNKIVSNIDLFIEEDVLPPLFDYFNAIFGLRESLRFGDYFTDSRTRPLAPGENTVPVVGDSVDVIDMSKSIIFQRFRNAVVKLGNNFGDYLRGIFHSSPSPDYHFPKFIVHQDFDVSGFEVSNTTSADQGAIVTNLNTQDDRYVFEVQCDMPCIIMGISYFSVPRVYMQTKERPFFHSDRFDFFNTMLQYLGDQPVYNSERSDLYPNNEVFGYQSRYNEYKQRYSVVSGGFVSELPAWTFVADPLFAPLHPIELSPTQSPEFIRAHDYEFNRFMSRVPGLSIGNGFHFIMVYNNKCVATRPMEVNPNTL